MQMQLVPFGSVTIGPQSWREGTIRSIRRAERLVRQTRAGQALNAVGHVSRSRQGILETKNKTRADEETGEVLPTSQKYKSTRQSTAAPAPFPLSSLRDQCAEATVAVASEYMRKVREVEGQLRRQASNVNQEVVKLQREKGHLESMLRKLSADLMVNRMSSEGRTRRPTARERERDGADYLLAREKKELLQLTREVEESLRSTTSQLQDLGHSNRQLTQCARERARVLELLPPKSSGVGYGASTEAKADPIGPFTPECKSILESSTTTVQQSERLRSDIRELLTSALIRQRDAHRAVNDGLVKKIAETVDLQKELTLTSAATRQALFRKQREVDCIRHSYGRAQGPEYSGDTLAREKLDRPLVRVYQRHPGTLLPEASRLIQGSTALRRCLESSEAELATLQRTCHHLLDDLRSKQKAAQVDSDVIRMRRHRVDKRAIPNLLQQVAYRKQRSLSSTQ
ncbi:coiled-coil domain-containing protein 105 [Synchiropus splendidus]|uniref:coiled-coil domain-containing protein 105 n=1 Tax=Synchiropus splendidus TaxID=270530 RepID=UPI00237E7391|nr:coiled-coil domain-containing protein 105 [Synchiropus splendidus]